MRLLLVPLVRTTTCISISAARRTLSSDIIMAASAPARLRIVQFQDSSKRSEGEGVGPPRVRVGAELRCGGPVVDVTAIDPSIPSDMRSFLKQWDQSTALTQKALEAAEASGCHVLEQGQFTLKAPIYDPQKVIGVGMNYVDHCTEQNFPVPKEPILFSKFSSSITEPYGDVIIPAETQCLDYEVELAFIICKKGKYIKEAEAMSHVAGFTVAHDVSARDWQMHKNGGQWLLGKTFDTFCPLGPALVTRAAISDPHKLGIRCRLNGEVVQNSNTDQLIHKTEQLVAFISRFVTLQPGDVVLTGTPPGVGCFKKPPVWLKKGDVVECEIDELGTIRNVIQ